MSLVARVAIGGAGLLLTSVSAIFGAFKFVEWAFGLATMPSNIDETQNALARFLRWLLEKDPNTAVLVAVGCLFLFGLLMMAWAIRRSQPIHAPDKGPAPPITWAGNPAQPFAPSSPPPPSLAPRPVLSAAQASLLQALQSFFSVQLWDACQHLKGAIESVLHDARQKRPGQLGALPYFKGEALENGMTAVVDRSRADLDAAVATGSLDNAEKAIVASLDSYQHTQRYVGELAAHLDVDLDANNAVAEWLGTDNTCLLKRRELASSRELRKLGEAVRGWRAADAHGWWREPTFTRSSFSGTSPPFPRGLYVGEMLVDAQRLTRDHYLTITVPDYP